MRPRGKKGVYYCEMCGYEEVAEPVELSDGRLVDIDSFIKSLEKA